MGDAGPPLAPRRFADLKTRILSASALGAAGLTMIWYGDIWILVLVVVLIGAMAWEWRSITVHGGAPCWADAVPTVAAVAAASLAAHFLSWTLGLAVLVLGLGAVLMLEMGGPHRAALGWTLLGGAYLGLAAIAFLYLRALGVVTSFWLILVVAAADVGGYFAGRLIGGPKLWPRVSPGKTWAGLVGGVAFAIVMGAVVSAATTGTSVVQVCAVSALIALVALWGDLAESALKRHFGVKDSGRLMPGHGGILDRFDGVIAAAVAAALASWLHGGTVIIW